MQKISLTLKSFDSHYLSIALIYLSFLAGFLNIKSIKRIDLPEKIKKITVARSPHIDKKSREQFQRRSHKSVLFLQIKKKKTLLLFVECLKNSQIYGVEMSIDIHSNSFYSF